VILPKAVPGKQGLKALDYAQEGLGGRETSSRLIGQAGLELKRSQSSARAHGVWQAPVGGTYSLRLTCDDYGALELDLRRLIDLHGTSNFNQGQVTLHLEAGPHLLVLELGNRLGEGWLKAEYLAPGQDQWRVFAGDELRFIDLGNFPAWHRTGLAAPLAVWWLLGLALVIWLLQRFLARLAARPAPRAADGSPSPLFNLGWVLACLGAAFGLLLATDLCLHAVYDQQGIHYNRRGYRGPLVPPKAPGEFRVAVFGGSGAFGYGQALEDCLPVVLQRALQKETARPLRVLNLAANEQGIYGIYHDVAAYQDLGYDLALLYFGATDSIPTHPHTANFRGRSPVFNLTGYLPILPRWLEEKRVVMMADLAGLAQAAGAGEAGLAEPVRFVLGQADQMLMSMQKALAGGDREARRQLAGGKARPFAFFLDYVGRTLDWLLAHDKQVICVGEPAMSGTLQQQMLMDFLAARYPGRVTYLDALPLLGLPMNEAFTDSVHFTGQGTRSLAQGLLPHLRQRIPSQPGQGGN
jgi:hypothetical protein